MLNKEDLFKENINLAYKFAHRYYGEIEPEDANQISLLALWRACLSFDQTKGYALSTYAYKVMQNEFNTYFRKENKQVFYTSLEQSVKEELKLSDCISCDIDYEEEVINKVDSENILSHINSIPKDNKEVFMMYMNGERQVDIAHKMNVSQPEICRRIKNVYSELRRIYYGRKDK